MATAADSKGPRFDWLVSVVVGLVAAGTLLATYKLDYIRRASYERAMELTRYAGSNDVGTLMLEVAYCRLTAAEAEAALKDRQYAEPVHAQALTTPMAAQLADG